MFTNIFLHKTFAPCSRTPIRMSWVLIHQGKHSKLSSIVKDETFCSDPFTRKILIWLQPCITHSPVTYSFDCNRVLRLHEYIPSQSLVLSLSNCWKKFFIVKKTHFAHLFIYSRDIFLNQTYFTSCMINWLTNREEYLCARQTMTLTCSDTVSLS